MFRLLSFVLLLAFCLPLAQAQSSKGDKILGLWLSETKEGKIQVYRVGNKYYGKLDWSKSMYGPDGKTLNKDTKNSDKNLRNRNLKDLVLLKDLTYDGEEYSGGTIYDPKNGSTYKCYMVLKGNDVLNIRGYIGISLIGRTSVWTRIKE